MLTGLRRGKGAQIPNALRRPELAGAEVALIADTDTRTPAPALYRVLLRQVRGGAAFAITPLGRGQSDQLPRPPPDRRDHRR